MSASCSHLSTYLFSTLLPSLFFFYYYQFLSPIENECSIIVSLETFPHNSNNNNNNNNKNCHNCTNGEVSGQQQQQQQCVMTL